jgi:transposase-like protein
MERARALRCPKGCKPAQNGFRFVRYYGPSRRAVYRCLKCNWQFSERYNSVFAGFRKNDETIYRILKALCEGNGIRATARIFGVDINTVTRILDQAAMHCQEVNEYMITNYHMEECQVDELWTFVKKRKHTSHHWKS